MDFGGGFAVGFVVGFGGGVGAGIGSGQGSARKKLKRQLTAAIQSGEISVADKNGESMTAESIIELLQEQFKKA